MNILNAIGLVILWRELDRLDHKIRNHERENYPARLATYAMIKTGHEIISEDEKTL